MRNVSYIDLEVPDAEGSTHTKFSSSGAKLTKLYIKCSEVSSTKHELAHSSRESAKPTRKKSSKGEMVAMITFSKK